MRHSEELKTLDKLAEVIGSVLDNMRKELAKDPPSVAPPRIKKEIEEQIPEIIDSLHPLTHNSADEWGACETSI